MSDSETRGSLQERVTETRGTMFLVAGAVLLVVTAVGGHYLQYVIGNDTASVITALLGGVGGALLVNGCVMRWQHWDAHRHKHTWSKWYEREARVSYLGMGARSVMVQCRDCETCGLMEHGRP